MSLVTAGAIATGVGIKISHEKNAQKGLEYIQQIEKKIEATNSQDCQDKSGIWSDLRNGCYKYEDIQNT